MDHGNTLCLMFGRPLVQATQRPLKMREGMRLMLAARSAPPHFVVNVMRIILQSVLTHTFVGTKLFIGTITHVTFVVQLEFTAFVLCCVFCREGFGVDSSLLWGLLEGRIKLGLKPRYLAQM